MTKRSETCRERAERPEARQSPNEFSMRRSRVDGRHWSFAYALLTAGLVTVAAAYTFGMWHMRQYPAADIWQHLAAINAIAERPFDPVNPFVESSDSSRLFGPLWVAIGMACSLFGLDVVGGFWIGGVLNLVLLATGVWLLGTGLFGGAKGAIALLAALLGGWIWSPNFTGYLNPLALLSSAAYPAITAVACSLILWGLSLRWLRGSHVGPWIAATGGLAFIVHPMGMVIGFIGCFLLASLSSWSSKTRRLGLIAVLASGILLSAAWPYFNPFNVLISASSPDWDAGMDFYNPYWILSSLFPAIVGLPMMFRRELRPFLFLLILCTVGFALGQTRYFVAGHRLLPWMALLLQIGLADALLSVFGSRSRPAVAAQALALSLIPLQAAWTFQTLQHEATPGGDLLADARGVLQNTNGGFAGYKGATFPLTALGQRVLSTPYAEPLVADMPQRQAASKRLFEIDDRDSRISAARALGVRYLVADVRIIPPDVAARLSHQARSVTQSGNLVRYELY